MERPPRNPDAGIFSRPLVALLLGGGIWAGLVTLSLFAWLVHGGHPVERAMAVTFLALVLVQFFHAYNVRSDRLSIVRQTFANRWLNIAILWELALLALILYLPVTQRAFRTGALAQDDWLIALAVAASIVPASEFLKWTARRGWLGPVD